MAYDSKKRFISYWHQIYEIIKLEPEKVLEIGIGNGFVSQYLKKRNLKIITLDIDEKLNPDKVGSVLNIPFAENSFEVVACYEVLEHLPYEKFFKAISEIFRVSKSYSVLSLPDKSRLCSLYLQIHKTVIFKNLLGLARISVPIHKFDGEHCWEIGKAGYPLEKITIDIQRTGFKIGKTYRIFENPEHRLFILRK